MGGARCQGGGNGAGGMAAGWDILTGAVLPLTGGMKVSRSCQGEGPDDREGRRGRRVESCRVADMSAAGGQGELGLRDDWAASCRVGGAAQVSSRWPRQILVCRRSSAGAKLRRRVPMCHTCGHACGCFQTLKGATRSALHETCVQFASTWPLLQSKFWKEKEIGDDIFRG